jgi:hypothetical protein
VRISSRLALVPISRYPQSALEALGDFDPHLSEQWGKLLNQPVEGLSLSAFDASVADADDVDLPAEREAFGRAVVAGCRFRLLSERSASLTALREGFEDQCYLIHQLGALSSAELLFMLRGKFSVSRADLLRCFDLSEHALSSFAVAGSDAPSQLRALIEDEDEQLGLSAEQRMELFQWTTALAALPCGGLKVPISLRLYEGAGDETLPHVHTCTHELHLPAYASRQALRAKLMVALAHRNDGFQVE